MMELLELYERLEIAKRLRRGRRAKAAEAVLHVGMKGGMCLMLNEEQVFQHYDRPEDNVDESNVQRECFQVSVGLREGCNPIIVRTWNRTKRWEFKIRAEVVDVLPDKVKYLQI
jgi:hypothetical protein